MSMIERRQDVSPSGSGTAAASRPGAAPDLQRPGLPAAARVAAGVACAMVLQAAAGSGAAAQEADTAASGLFPSDTAQRLQGGGAQFVAAPSDFPSREELEERADSLRSAVQAAEKEEEQEQMKEALSRVEGRLEDGDFSRGDVVRLRVQGEPRWTGHFTVGPNSRIRLPDVGPVSLQGTLYSEADARLREVLSRYVRRPELQVQPLTRVAVQGAVEEPGFYNIPPSTTLSALVMQAGGPLQSAEMEDLKVRRDGDRIAEGENLAYEGRSLEELGMRSGDAVHIPEEGNAFSVRNVGFALGSVASFVSVMLTVF